MLLATGKFWSTWGSAISRPEHFFFRKSPSLALQAFEMFQQSHLISGGVLFCIERGLDLFVFDWSNRVSNAHWFLTSSCRRTAKNAIVCHKATTYIRGQKEHWAQGCYLRQHFQTFFSQIANLRKIFEIVFKCCFLLWLWHADLMWNIANQWRMIPFK